MYNFKGEKVFAEIIDFLNKSQFFEKGGVRV